MVGCGSWSISSTFGDSAVCPEETLGSTHDGTPEFLSGAPHQSPEGHLDFSDALEPGADEV